MEPVRQLIIAGLEADIIRHDLRRYSDIGIEHENLDRYQASLGTFQDDETLVTALKFWEAWIELAGQGFKQEPYSGIKVCDWPKYAREIIGSLTSHKPLGSQLLNQYFAGNN
jgi:hypothetical protein